MYVNQVVDAATFNDEVIVYVTLSVDSRATIFY